jgi:hypothetical protein
MKSRENSTISTYNGTYYFISRDGEKENQVFNNAERVSLSTYVASRSSVRSMLELCGLISMREMYHARGYLHHGLGVGGHLVCPQTKGTARFSRIKISPTSCPLALSVPQRRP